MTNSGGESTDDKKEEQSEEQDAAPPLTSIDAKKTFLVFISACLVETAVQASRARHGRARCRPARRSEA